MSPLRGRDETDCESARSAASIEFMSGAGRTFSIWGKILKKSLKLSLTAANHLNWPSPRTLVSLLVSIFPVVTDSRTALWPGLTLDMVDAPHFWGITCKGIFYTLSTPATNVTDRFFFWNSICVATQMNYLFFWDWYTFLELSILSAWRVQGLAIRP